MVWVEPDLSWKQPQGFSHIVSQIWAFDPAYPTVECIPCKNTEKQEKPCCPVWVSGSVIGPTRWCVFVPSYLSETRPLFVERWEQSCNGRCLQISQRDRENSLEGDMVLFSAGNLNQNAWNMATHTCLRLSLSTHTVFRCIQSTISAFSCIQQVNMTYFVCKKI